MSGLMCLSLSCFAEISLVICGLVQVYGICFCPVSKNSDLKALGVDDSKALTEEQRYK